MEGYGRVVRVSKNDKCTMSVIFNRDDFELCDVPVPKGYPQSQTHAGVVIKGDVYYLTTSPYPSIKRPRWYIYIAAALRKLSFNKIGKLKIGEDYENPMLYEAVKYTEDKIAVGFRLVKGSPLMPKPIDNYGGGSFCSDPDVSIIGEYICVLNRTTVRGNKSYNGDTFVHLIKGNVEENSFVQNSARILFKEGLKSPCLIEFAGKNFYFSLDTNSYNDGQPCKALLKRDSDDMIHWSNLKEVELEKGDYEPWHMSVFTYHDRLYSIIACVKKGESHRCWQMFGEFNDSLSKLTIYQTPLTDYQSYRGAACVTAKGEFVLYNTTVREYLKGGKSVDGREIIMAHMPFTELLKKIRDNER